MIQGSSEIKRKPYQEEGYLGSIQEASSPNLELLSDRDGKPINS